MRFKVQVCVSVLFWLFSFARRDDKKKIKNSQPSDNLPLLNLTEPSLNEPVKTLEVQQLRIRIKKMCHAPLISLQVSMKQYYGMP